METSRSLPLDDSGNLKAGVTMRASDLFVKALENEGVEYIFGVPGEENLDLVDSLRGSSVKLVVTRHEQAAGFMAATVGRLTGKAGVALSTLGPGATNLLTAAAYAQLGGFPMLMITGQKPIMKSKQGRFQIVDIVGMMTPSTKMAVQVVDGGLVPALVREAMRRAGEEKPGATHLELPEDVAQAQVAGEQCVLFHVDRVRRPVAEDTAIARALQLLRDARHPLLVLGAGANRKRTCNMLRQLVREHGLFFCETQMGKGVVDSRDPRYLGTAATSAGDYIHAALDHADLILMVGHDVVEKPPFFMTPLDARKVVHINYYSAQVDQVYCPHLEVIGDIANAIWRLKEGLKEGHTPQQWGPRYFGYIKACMEQHMTWGTTCGDAPLQPPCFVDIMRQAMPEDGILCLDNGLYKVWFARQYKTYQPNTLLLDNALATMGAGLPTAIAAKLVAPQQTVVAVCGDGGFMMNSQELITAVALKLHITVLVLNDNCYGMIKWKQAGRGLESFGMDLANPDFVQFAEAHGARGYRASGTQDLAALLQHCVSQQGGVHVVEVPISYAVSDRLEVKALKENLSRTLKSYEEFVKDAPPLQQQQQGHGDGADGDAKPQATSPGPPPEEVAAASQLPFYLAGKAQMPNNDLLVMDKYTGKVAYAVAKASEQDVERAIAAAVDAFPAFSRLASYQRREMLEHCVQEFKERAEELAQALCTEAGKPIKDARGEVTRLIETFTIAMEESTRVGGEYAPMDISQRCAGLTAVVRRFPVGPVAMVSPFNFPLNLTAHKVAPALAVGCTFVLKPASRTPIGALLIGEVLSRAPHMVPGAFSVLPCSRGAADLLVTDDRFKLLSFTGSAAVGWDMKSRAGRKPVVLELGGNAACVVEDVRGGPGGLDDVIAKLVHGAYYQSGQSCISVQRLLVRQDLYSEVRGKLVEAVRELVEGDPHRQDVFIGPLISEREAQRVQQWVEEAVGAGGKVVAGGGRRGVVMEATLLEGVPPRCRLSAEEVFGPVMVMQPYATFKEAVDKVNDSRYGLQAGVFTCDWDKAWYAFEHLDVGGVVINQVPSIRVDSQAYGGNKDSGLGREGVRWAMRDMTVERTMLMSGAGQL